MSKRLKLVCICIATIGRGFSAQGRRWRVLPCARVFENSLRHASTKKPENYTCFRPFKKYVFSSPLSFT